MIGLVFATLLAQSTSAPSPAATPTMTASPTIAPSPTLFAFTPPAGWKKGAVGGTITTASGEVDTVYGTWTSTPMVGATEALVVIVGSGAVAPTLDGLEGQVKATVAKYTNGRITSIAPVPLCGGIAGAIVKYSYQTPTARLSGTEVLAINSGRSYAALYMHRADLPDEQVGLDAISALCPVGYLPAVPVKDDTLPPIAAPNGFTRQSFQAAMPLHPTMWLWTHPLSPTSTEVIEAIALKLPLSPASTKSSAPPDWDYLMQRFIAGISRWATHVQILDHRPVVGCETPEESVHLTAVASGVRMDMQTIVAIALPNMYAAFYMRPMSAPENPDAIHSIKSLCPAGAPSTT